jgi:hypothetical protein
MDRRVAAEHEAPRKMILIRFGRTPSLYSFRVVSSDSDQDQVIDRLGLEAEADSALSAG